MNSCANDQNVLIQDVLLLECVVLMTGYNKWREFCGLETATSFDSMVDITDPAVRRRFRTLYRQIAICCFHCSVSVKVAVMSSVHATAGRHTLSVFIGCENGRPDDTGVHCSVYRP